MKFKGETSVCGIVGIVSGAMSDDVRNHKMSHMLSSIEHRGPDDSGIFSSSPVSIGMVRLSVVDLVSGSQPMILSNCKQPLEIVFNGEIYNHKELRDRLHKLGHTFNSSHSDTEVILHAYEEWGQEAFSRLNGMFAIAILDRKSGILLLIRDALGEKPLYFLQDSDTLAFASEVKGLVQAFNLQNCFDHNVIENYFQSGCNYSSDSFFSKVKKLMPGHFAVISLESRTKILEKRFGRFIADDSVETTPIDSNSFFEHLLRRSVEKRLDTDVNTGLYLSGGLDSSAIALLAHELSPNIESFSVGFSESDFDEANQATEFARYLGIKNSQVICDEKYAISFLSKLGNILDEPIADPSIIPTTLLSEFASQKIKVALGGDGSDEVSYGYNTFKQFSKVDLASKWVPRGLIHLAAKSGNSSELKWKMTYLNDLIKSNSEERVAKATSPYYRYHLNHVREMSSIPALSSVRLNAPAELFNDTIVDAYVSTYMREQILVKIDRASMYSSVELRSPFLDYELLAYMARCSKSFKYSKGVGKLPLRAFLAKEVPGEMLKRKKKGFGIPLDEWGRGKFGASLFERVGDGDWTGTSITPQAIDSLKKTIQAQDVSQTAVEYLWSLAVFQIWRQRWS